MVPLSDLWSRDSCRLSLRPPALLKSFRSGLQLPHLVDGPPLWMSSSSLHLFVRLFPDEPGRGLQPRRRQYFVRYGKTRYRPIYCRRAKRLLCEDAVPCGLVSATTKRSSSCEAACLPAPRLNSGRVGVPVNSDGGDSIPYTPPQCTRSAAATLQDRASVRPPVR